MDISSIVDHAHDDFVELAFLLGVVSCDQTENRRFFDAVFAILMRRIGQAAREVLHEERRRMREQLQRVSRQ